MTSEDSVTRVLMKWKELNELVLCIVKSITYEFRGDSSKVFFRPAKRLNSGKYSKKKS